VIITPGGPDWSRAFDDFEHSAFRWEAQQEYEDEAVGAFRAGEPKPAMPGKERWCARVRAARAAGKEMSRVHGVRHPLTDYMMYELTWSYPPNVDAGENILIMQMPDELPDQEILSTSDDLRGQDFWLFDSSVLLWLNYDAGRLVSADLTEDPDMIVAANRWRDAVMEAGTSLQDYMKEHQDA
jgi:hypothetical protein